MEVDSSLIRGPQPGIDDLRILRESGLTGVIDLRDESRASEHHCGILGLDYHRIAVVDWETPNPGQVRAFLAIVQSGGKFLVHCLGGVGRTGIMVSCYRIAQGWTAEEAIGRSHIEVPWLPMKANQLKFVREFERNFSQK